MQRKEKTRSDLNLKYVPLDIHKTNWIREIGRIYHSSVIFLTGGGGGGRGVFNLCRLIVFSVGLFAYFMSVLS